jgi:long-chain fatty acid transport protein
MTARRLLLALALAGLALAAAPPGRADPLDTLGFGPRSAAMGTAGRAAGEPLEAAVHNAGAAARGAGPALAVGYLAAFPDATLNGRAAELEPAHGVVAAAALPFRLGALRLGAALALHVPDRFLARIGLPGATEPRLLRWSDWLHRTSITAVLAAELGGGFSLGAGASLLADARARGSVRLDTPTGTPRGAADVTLEMPLRAAAVAGLLFEPAPFLAFGLTFRDALAMDVSLDLAAHAELADDALTGDARARLDGTAYYTPRTLAFGLTARWAGFTLCADVAWQQWSGLSDPVADVAAAVALGAEAAILHRLFPHPAWLDTVVPAVGLEYEFSPAAGHRVAVRTGYAYEPSPVPPQTGLGNLADPDRHLFTVGAGWKLALDDDGTEPADDDEAGGETAGAQRELQAGVALQAHWLPALHTAKTEPELAGDALSADGRVWTLQLWTGVTL